MGCCRSKPSAPDVTRHPDDVNGWSWSILGARWIDGMLYDRPNPFLLWLVEVTEPPVTFPCVRSALLTIHRMDETKDKDAFTLYRLGRYYQYGMQLPRHYPGGGGYSSGEFVLDIDLAKASYYYNRVIDWKTANGGGDWSREWSAAFDRDYAALQQALLVHDKADRFDHIRKKLNQSMSKPSVASLNPLPSFVREEPQTNSDHKE